MPSTSSSISFEDLVTPTFGTGFAELRPGQRAALHLYAHGEFQKADLGIELPTGGGKTLIALLILEYWRRRGNKVAILTGNKALARQIEREAEILGVSTVRFEGSGRDFPPGEVRRYHRAQAVAVMNYWVYIQQSPTVQRADYLVLDDAQLAEGSLNSLYTVSVSRWKHRALFDALMRLIAHHTPSPPAQDFVMEVATGPVAVRPVDLIAFPYLDELRSLIQVAVSEYLERPSEVRTDADRDLSFRWGRVRGSLDHYLFFVSSEEIEFRPLCYPARDYPHLSSAKQRIYLSATLHDPEDLQRRLGTQKITKLDIPAAESEVEEGRRLFVFNQHGLTGTRGEVPEHVLHPLRQLLVRTRKSLWLCTSMKEAEKWEVWLRNGYSEPRQAGEPNAAANGALVAGAPNAPRTWLLGTAGDELDQFSAASEGHLVIGGRFEGMDFPDDTCRLAVFPSLPSATGLLERFVAEQLQDAGFQRTRMLERVKQGIGRCTRGDDDYAVYYFLDPRFYEVMESAEFGALVSDRTRRQVEVGLELTERDMSGAAPLAAAFLSGDFSDFDAREQRATPPPVHVADVPGGTAEDEVRGWLSMTRSNFTDAANRFDQVARSMSSGEREHRAFWYYQAGFAEYLRLTEESATGALERSVKLLETSREEGASSSWFNRLARALNKLRQSTTPVVGLEDERIFDVWDRFVERQSYRNGRFLRWQAGLQANLVGTHNQVAEGLELLGLMLGFTSSRPAGDGSADGIWVSENSAVTLEAKIEVLRQDVVLSDVNQAHGQRRAAVTALGLPDDAVDALIVTNLEEIHDAAAAALATGRVVALPVVERLRLKLESVLVEYWRTWSASDAGARLAARQAAGQKLPPADWLHRAIRRSAGAFLTEEELFSEWP